MLFFKNFLLNEIAEPTKPSDIISKTNIKKDAGTWKERPVIQYKFKTTMGNEVKVHFEKTDQDTYDVMFYVNNTQYDNASSNEKNKRDTEILGNVLWLIQNKAEQLRIKKLTFTAQKGQNDIRTIRNLDVNKYKKIFFDFLNKLKIELNNYQVKLIEPNKQIYIKLNRPIPVAKPDVDKDLFNRIFQKINQLILNNESLEDLLNNTYHAFEDLKKVGIDTSKFLQSFRDLSNAIQSNLPSGWSRSLNRREIVWEKLVNKYFSNWNIKKDGVKFELTRR